MKNQSSRFLVIVGGLSLALALPAFASEAEDLFHRMDGNGDKKVTTIEHATFAENQFKQADADYDGKVSAAECESAATTDKKKVDKQATVTHMRLVDTDGDGQISQAENTEYARKSFVRADRNSDGVLTEDEFEKFYHATKEELKKD
ncbi:MAG TPA: hypothetical protein VG734_22345 [Lacunisphaera sp.]|nr:hypothetical protein [Lacunisphaera sp.]